MVNIAKIGKFVTNVVKSSDKRKLICSTGGDRGIFLDAFKAYNSKPHMVNKISKSVFSTSERVLPKAKNVFAEMCDNLGSFNIRQKSLKKLKSKIPNALNELSLSETTELFNKGGIKDLIGDGCGTRIVLNNAESRKELLSRLINAHNSGKITLQKVENYHGKGIKPYLDNDDLMKLQELEYIDAFGRRQGVQIVDKIKEAGYTRVNMDLLVNGGRTEFQIGGKYTTRFGEVEHYLYDMRRKGSINLAKLSEAQKNLFNKMREKYLQIIKNPSQKDKYNDYLTNVWKSLKEAENGNIKFQFPELPIGLPKILSAEYLFKFEKGAM